MQEQQIRNTLSKEVYLTMLYLALVAIRSAADIEQARLIAHIFHNLPTHLRKKEWDAEAARMALEELEAKAAEAGLSDQLDRWLEAATSYLRIEASAESQA